MSDRPAEQPDPSPDDAAPPDDVPARDDGPGPARSSTPPGAARRRREPAAVDGAASPEPGSAGHVPATEPLGVERRLARVHVRVGMYALARAELETLAARGGLDAPALADLAEVRWRTGDLVGAGEAAQAYLDAGGTELVALCIAAEAAAAAGRMPQARHLAARVLGRGRDRLDDLFAGQPRSGIWPELEQPIPQGPPSRPGPPIAEGAAPAPAGGAGSDAEGSGAGSPGQGVSGTVAPDRYGRPAGSRQGGVNASADLADIQARVARGDLAGVGTRLALVLRALPVLAPAVLAAADEALASGNSGPEAPGLHLARGDAYRLMGRETLAAEAFQQSSRALRSVPRSEENP